MGRDPVRLDLVLLILIHDRHLFLQAHLHLSLLRLLLHGILEMLHYKCGTERLNLREALPIHALLIELILVIGIVLVAAVVHLEKVIVEGQL